VKRFLLDTNVISEAGRSRGSAKVKTWLMQHEAASAIPSIVIAERAQGAFLNRERREALLKQLSADVAEAGDAIVPFDTAAALAWGEYTARPEIRAANPGIRDTLIAAIALSRELVVATRNTAHFPGVETVNPFAD
jgi:predicted nucleic acid-binding protein